MAFTKLNDIAEKFQAIAELDDNRSCGIVKFDGCCDFQDLLQHNGPS